MKKIAIGLFLFLGLLPLETVKAQEIIAELDNIASTSVCDMNASNDGNIIVMGALGIQKITPDGDIIWTYLTSWSSWSLYEGANKFAERSNGNLLFPMNRLCDRTPIVTEYSSEGELQNYMSINCYPSILISISCIEMPNHRVISSLQKWHGGVYDTSYQLAKFCHSDSCCLLLTELGEVNAPVVAALDTNHFLAAVNKEGVAIVSTTGEVISRGNPPYYPQSYTCMERVTDNLFVATSYDTTNPQSTATLSYYDGNGEYLTHTTVSADWFWDIALDTSEESIYISGNNLDGKSTIWNFDYTGQISSTFTLYELDIAGNGITFLDDFVYVSGKSNEYQKTLVVKIAKGVVNATPNLEKKVNVTLYPNPAREKVVFEVDCEAYSKCTVVVRNLQGQVIERLLLLNGQAVWQAENIARGLYLYSIETENRVINSGKLELR